MSYVLSPSVYLAQVDDAAVWLDLGDDSYLCTPDTGITWTAQGCLQLDDKALAEDLVDAGLIIPAACGPGPARLAPPPRADLALAARPFLAQPPPLRWWTASLRRHYCYGRTASLLQLTRIAARLGARPVCAAPAMSLQAAVHRILRAQRWLPLAGECLPRSFQMVCMLREAGFTCQWVFGVRTWPFAAHCWVESDGVALNDSAERLAAFQPIHSV